MKVMENTPERLVLDDRPVVLGSALAGLVVLMAGITLATLAQSVVAAMLPLLGVALFGVAFAAFVRRSTAKFDRAAGVFTLRVARVTGVTEATYPLGDIVGAGVETTRSGSSAADGGGRRTGSKLHRPVVRLRGGAEPVVLNDVFAAGGGAEAAAAAVNAWLARRA